MAKRGWSNPLGGFAREVEATQNKRLRAAALQALSGVIERSPVDQGTFRGSHRVSVGSPDYGYSLTDTDKAGSATLAKGSSAIQVVRAPFTVIYVQSNLPYAETLENGNSQQAPQGVYQITMNNLKEASGRDF
tara:strand:+ start:1586 stop:1984 length:399 start_codon:yes stop_codon:yes gene_type:complete